MKHVLRIKRCVSVLSFFLSLFLLLDVRFCVLLVARASVSAFRVYVSKFVCLLELNKRTEKEEVDDE